MRYTRYILLALFGCLKCPYRVTLLGIDVPYPTVVEYADQAVFVRDTTEGNPDAIQENLETLYEKASGEPVPEGYHVCKAGDAYLGPESAQITLVKTKTEVTLERGERRCIITFPLGDHLRAIQIYPLNEFMPPLEPKMTIDRFFSSGVDLTRFDVFPQIVLNHCIRPIADEAEPERRARSIELPYTLTAQAIIYLSEIVDNIPYDIPEEIMNFLVVPYCSRDTDHILSLIQSQEFYLSELTHDNQDNPRYLHKWLRWLGKFIRIFTETEYEAEYEAEEDLRSMNGHMEARIMAHIEKQEAENPLQD